MLFRLVEAKFLNSRSSRSHRVADRRIHPVHGHNSVKFKIDSFLKNMFFFLYESIKIQIENSNLQSHG